MIDEEKALGYLISELRSDHHHGRYGYDLYIPSVIEAYIRSTEKVDEITIQVRVQELSPPFLAAAWNLARRGIVRPGVKILGAQHTSDGDSGAGFSLTPFGKVWLTDSDRDDYVPTEPGRFSGMLEPHRKRLGSGFYERAQEAVKCYGAHAYLACCAMCGAASESILLAAAIARFGDEPKILSDYAASGGRGRIETRLLGQAPEWLRREFSGFLTLLKYWRDEAAHGRPSGITDDEAYTSLALLLRLAKYADEHWELLTTASVQDD